MNNSTSSNQSHFPDDYTQLYNNFNNLSINTTTNRSGNNMFPPISNNLQEQSAINLNSIVNSVSLNNIQLINSNFGTNHIYDSTFQDNSIHEENSLSEADSLSESDFKSPHNPISQSNSIINISLKDLQANSLSLLTQTLLSMSSEEDELIIYIDGAGFEDQNDKNKAVIIQQVCEFLEEGVAKTKVSEVSVRFTNFVLDTSIVIAIANTLKSENSPNTLTFIIEDEENVYPEKMNDEFYSRFDLIVDSLHVRSNQFREEDLVELSINSQSMNTISFIGKVATVIEKAKNDHSIKSFSNNYSLSISEYRYRVNGNHQYDAAFDKALIGFLGNLAGQTHPRNFWFEINMQNLSEMTIHSMSDKNNILLKHEAYPYGFSFDFDYLCPSYSKETSQLDDERSDNLAVQIYKNLYELLQNPERGDSFGRLRKGREEERDLVSLIAEYAADGFADYKTIQRQMENEINAYPSMNTYNNNQSNKLRRQIKILPRKIHTNNNKNNEMLEYKTNNRTKRKAIDEIRVGKNRSTNTIVAPNDVKMNNDMDMTSEN